MLGKLTQADVSRLWRAIIEFDLLQDGDRILIGLSGGKDSMLLLYALSHAAKIAPLKISLAALTIDPMFSEDFPVDKLHAFCTNLNIPFYTEKVNLKQAINDSNQNDPCYTCSFFRRGAMNNFAKNNNFNKLALAHHHDDAVETFVMNLFNSGQLKTFLPKTYLDRSNITVIRPFIYYREKDIISIVNKVGITPVKSPCPFDGHTNRQITKELIKTLSENNKFLYDHLSAAMRENSSSELWPPKKTKDELSKKFYAFWHR